LIELGRDDKVARMTMAVRCLLFLRKRFELRFWTSCLILVSAFDLSASEKNVLPDFLLRSWDSGNGLPPGWVQAIEQSDDGYLWVGTSRGLARFDGARFVVFNPENTPALADSRITALLISHTGDLWIGTENGQVVRRHGDAFEPVSLGAEASGQRINTLAEDRTGAIWIGTKGNGIVRWQNGACDGFKFGKTTSFDVNNVSQVIADHQGRLWAIVNQQLAVFEKDAWKIASGRYSSGSRHVMALAPAREGGIWVATCLPQDLANRGALLFKLDDKGWHQLSDPCPWPQQTVFTRPERVLEDGSGRLWLATFGAGIFVWSENGGWHSLNDSGHPSLVECRSLFEGKDGIIWAGTTDFLLAQIRSRPVTVLHLPEKLNQNVVFTTCVRRDGSVWIGTDGSGACCYQNGEFTNADFGGATENLQVFTIYEDPQTNLWAGTLKGLYNMSEGRFKRVTSYAHPEIAQALAQAVLALNRDSRGNLWVGTGAGVVRLGPDGGKLFARAEGIDHDYIRAIEEDRSGQIWVAITDRGLYRKVGKRFERYSATNWPGIDRIRGLHADADGGLWMTTDREGLGWLNDGKFLKWTVEDGLPTDDLITATEDSDGNLWISSANGIFGCPKARLLSYQRGVSPPIVFWQLTTADGMDTQRCTGAGQPVTARSSDGRLWFPNWHALAVFDPGQIQCYFRKRTRPPIIEEVMVDGAHRLPSADGALRVDSGAGNVEFHYSSPVFLSSERLQFRYQLKKLDAGWVNAGQRRVAYYNHLPVGKYEFQVQAAGPDGEWRDAWQTLAFEVTPRFWERPWVQAVGATMILAAMSATIWGVARVRFRRRLRKLEARQTIERERRRIAQDLHDDIGAGVSQLIMIGEMAGRESVSDAEARRQLQTMTRKSRELAQSMDETIWALNPRNDSLAGLVGYLQYYATEFLDTAQIRCRAEVPSDLPEMRLEVPVRHNLLLATKQALHNVAEHSGAQEVWLRFQCDNHLLQIMVQDNGRGFDLAQASDVRNGLENMRARLEKMGGTCQINSSPGSGCFVCFTLALDTLPKPLPQKITVSGDGANPGVGSK
jgi:ligand-binding sensor domain-containing protein/signal transduction histidine kinase